MNPLLNVDAALENILATVRLLPAETITLAEAHGRVIAEDIISPIDLPPFDNSAMDGYALYSDGQYRRQPSKPDSASGESWISRPAARQPSSFNRAALRAS